MKCAALPGVVLALGLLSTGAPAAERKPREKRVWCTVARVTSIDGSVKYEIIETSKITARRTELMTAYRNEMGAWNKESTAFRREKGNAGKSFTKPRPAMPMLVAEKQVRGKAEGEKVVAELEAKHCVVRIRGSDGKVSFEAVQMIQLGPRKAELDRQYAAALAAWQDQSNAFKKENPGKRFTESRPGKPSLMVVQQNLKDKSLALTMVSKLEGKRN